MKPNNQPDPATMTQEELERELYAAERTQYNEFPGNREWLDALGAEWTRRVFERVAKYRAKPKPDNIVRRQDKRAG